MGGGLVAAPCGDGLLVEGFVFRGGFAPAEVLAHGFDAHLVKDIGAVTAGICGPGDGLIEALSVHLPEFEAGADFRLLMVIDDAVMEAAGGSDDGEGAVAHAVHLVEAAGFKV